MSWRLEWNATTLIYSGDTSPSYFVVENGGGADMLIHETFDRWQVMMERAGYDERTAARRLHRGAFRSGRSWQGAGALQSASCRQLSLLQR